ncbi:MAG: hypothetical protein ACI32N_01690 [Bulleidia sp.]
MRRIWITVLTAMLFLTGCGKQKDYEMIQTTEYHFLPEEYDPSYAHVNDVLELEQDGVYQIALSAVCQEGTMEIVIIQGDQILTYEADIKHPCQETMEITKTTQVKLQAAIHETTKGDLCVQLLRK